MVVIRLLLMMVALERYNKRAQWHPVNPSPPSQGSGLQVEHISTTSYILTQSSSPTQGSDLQVEHISTTSYILIHLNLFPLSSEHFRTALHILRKAVFISCSSRVRLTGGTHQHNLYILIHLTQGCEPLPPFKWTLQHCFTHLTQSCVHLLLLKVPTYKWNTSAQIIHFIHLILGCDPLLSFKGQT